MPFGANFDTHFLGLIALPDFNTMEHPKFSDLIQFAEQDSPLQRVSTVFGLYNHEEMLIATRRWREREREREIELVTIFSWEVTGLGGG